ncbi:MAG: hypothetical protein H6736_15795 [Alphaproteobacteria bacterium]|nr:hypothetical protein [Alphaproteobacteria bacterium]
MDSEYRARTSATQDGRVGAVIVIGLTGVAVVVAAATQETMALLIAAGLGALSMLSVGSLVSRALAGGPTVTLHGEAVAGQPVGLTIRFAWPVGRVTRVDVMLTLSDGKRSHGRSQEARVMAVEDREIVLELDLPEVPHEGAWTWGIEVTPSIRTPFVDQDVPSEMLKLSCSGLPLA